MLKDFYKGFWRAIGAVVGICTIQWVAEKIGAKVLEKKKEDFVENLD